MVQIIPFAAWRPATHEAATFACPPYDVLSRDQATQLAPNHRFIHVIRPEINLPATVDEDSVDAHTLARKQLENFKRTGVLIRDEQPTLYVYRQTGFGHVQTGVVACVRVADYRNGVIKQHEKTLVAKELNRIHHFEATHAQTEPVFLMYRQDAQISALVAGATACAPEYDFSGDDGVRHEFWPIGATDSAQIVHAFSRVDSLYIADGHHRSASAVKVAGACGLDDDDPRASIMAVIFPANDLKVLAYNRVVQDLGGMSPDEFVTAIAAAHYCVTPCSSPSEAQPQRKGEFGVYIGATHQWLLLRYEGNPTGNVVDDLDTSILTRTVLTPILNIEDLRTNPRIDFVGGSAGIEGLENGAGASGVAFSLYPTAVADVMAVSDAGEIMPPKSTWFEPKLASGLFIHDLD